MDMARSAERVQAYEQPQWSEVLIYTGVPRTCERYLSMLAAPVLKSSRPGGTIPLQGNLILAAFDLVLPYGA